MPSDSSENLHIEACVWRNWCGKKVGATTATYLSVAVSLVEWTLDGSSISLPLLLSASFLALPTLYAEVTARIVSEMAHGLFHALLPFAAYEALTKGAWRAGGCTCCKCTQRIPGILAFALRPDVTDPVLEHGGRCALVGLFSMGRLTPGFAGLPRSYTPPRSRGCRSAARWLMPHIVDDRPVGGHRAPLLEVGRAYVDGMLGNDTAAVLGAAECVGIMEGDGMRFADGERVGCVMRGVVWGTGEGNAGTVYQALVNVLILPHPAPADETAFPA
ncbi:hypothetical protein B0H11DRAFT_1942493 [Mycena galericulata]|nr:hypothetical protein B0H11DRAFT_1942493 [Mycena galericulata]